MERKTRDSPRKKGTSFKQRRPYKKFSPDSPPTELSQQEKDILGRIVNNRRTMRDDMKDRPSYKFSRKYNKKDKQKELTKLQKKYDKMPRGPEKTKLKDKISKKELLLSSTDYGTALEITDDDDFDDNPIPVQHAVAIPVVDAIPAPRTLGPIKLSKKKN